MDKHPPGTTGAASRDGMMDNGGKARTGPCTVPFAVCDLAGDVEGSRKTGRLGDGLG